MLQPTLMSNVIMSVWKHNYMKLQPSSKCYHAPTTIMYHVIIMSLWLYLNLVPDCNYFLKYLSCVAGVKRRKRERRTARTEGLTTGREPPSRLVFRVLGSLTPFPFTPTTQAKNSLNKSLAVFLKLKCAQHSNYLKLLWLIKSPTLWVQLSWTSSETMKKLKCHPF